MEPTDTIAERTQECIREINARFKNTRSLSDVVVMIGRTGTGKSCLLEYLTNLSGYSQMSISSVTQEFAIAKAVIDDKGYFIMDTPGFEPGDEEKTYREIVRGIQAIRPVARIAGFLYLTSISQQRFDNFDRKLTRLIHTLSGDEYIPRVTLITTFWTPNANQQAASRLDALQLEWKKAVGASQLTLYQHGREYLANGRDTRSVLDWEQDRNRIAQHARNMIARHYGRPENSAVTPRIVRELDAGTAVHDTDAGKLLGLGPPIPPATGWSWVPAFWDFVGWVSRNVDFRVDLGGAGRGHAFPMGNSYRGPLDPNSSRDVMRARGLDYSREGRLRYAARNGIGGEPFSAAWGEAIRSDVLRRHG